MKTFLVSLLALSTIGCASTSKGALTAVDARPGVARVQFERIVALAGDWSGKFGEGAEAGPGATKFRVTAGGSVVEETLFAGTSHEMVTMYHLDGGRLVLTHYCAAGNQPRMVARSTEADRDSKTIRFDFAGAGNLASPDDGHMHEAVMTIDGDHLVSAWTFYEKGEPTEVARFDLRRKTATAAEATGSTEPALLGDADGGLFDRIVVDQLSSHFRTK